MLRLFLKTPPKRQAWEPLPGPLSANLPPCKSSSQKAPKSGAQAVLSQSHRFRDKVFIEIKSTVGQSWQGEREENKCVAFFMTWIGRFLPQHRRLDKTASRCQKNAY